ncbi:MAG TPA: hypothetical protein VKQ71_15980 [Acidimicrobiales bacterium]|nr:hypothetical protein [Acidimicrobiales bacterium]
MASLDEDPSPAVLGFSHRLDGDTIVGEVEITDHVRVPGTTMVRPSILAKLSDVAAGALANRRTAPQVALTVDLTVRSLAVTDRPTLAIVARLVKFGRTTIIGEVWFSEPGSERPVALSHVTFTPSPRPQDVHQGIPTTRAFNVGEMTRPFAEQVASRVIQPGVVEIDRHPYVMQASGTIQGGVISLLGELAAESLMGAPVLDLEMRYLSTVRSGPARTSAIDMGGSVVRVEVRDAGNDDRFAALIMARTAPRREVADG